MPKGNNPLGINQWTGKASAPKKRSASDIRKTVFARNAELRKLGVEKKAIDGRAKDVANDIYRDAAAKRAAATAMRSSKGKISKEEALRDMSFVLGAPKSKVTPTGGITNPMTRAMDVKLDRKANNTRTNSLVAANKADVAELRSRAAELRATAAGLRAVGKVQGENAKLLKKAGNGSMMSGISKSTGMTFFENVKATLNSSLQDRKALLAANRPKKKK